MARGRPRKTDDPLLKSAELIGWALGGLEREIAQTRERLTALTSQAATLRARLGRGVSRTAATDGDAAKGPQRGRASRRSQMSEEARQRMSEMMRKRWAERKRRGLKKL